MGEKHPPEAKVPPKIQEDKKKESLRGKETQSGESEFFSGIQGLVLVCGEELRIWDREPQRSTANRTQVGRVGPGWEEAHTCLLQSTFQRHTFLSSASAPRNLPTAAGAGGTAGNKLQARQPHALPAPVCPCCSSSQEPGECVGFPSPPPAEASGRKGPSSASEGEWTQAWSLWFPNLSKASYFCFSHFPFMITKTFPPLWIPSDLYPLY